MSDWFQNRRVEWIVESVRIFGFIRREHIQRKFDISVPQASADIAKVIEKFPALMTYNRSTKQYERAADQSALAQSGER